MLLPKLKEAHPEMEYLLSKVVFINGMAITFRNIHEAIREYVGENHENLLNASLFFNLAADKAFTATAENAMNRAREKYGENPTMEQLAQQQIDDIAATKKLITEFMEAEK